jgi:hypothetical protein
METETDLSLNLLIQQIRQAATKDLSSTSSKDEDFKAHGKHRGADPIWEKIMDKLNDE